MIHFQRSHTINANSASVWDVLSRYMHIDEFSPGITSVDALTNGKDGVGSKRRNHFPNGTSLVEEVTAWEDGHKYRVKLSEMDALPLKEAQSEISIKPMGGDKTHVVWTFEYRMKYGPLGWLMGQTMLKMVMGKALDANLKGLAAKVGPN